MTVNHLFRNVFSSQFTTRHLSGQLSDRLGDIPTAAIVGSDIQYQAGVVLGQFMRLAYFNVDAVDSKPGAPVFNRTVTLRDAWAKIVKKGGGK